MTTALATYTRRTTERVELEVDSLVGLLIVLGEAGVGKEVVVEIFDGDGHRHKIVAYYAGETTGLHL